MERVRSSVKHGNRWDSRTDASVSQLLSLQLWRSTGPKTEVAEGASQHTHIILGEANNFSNITSLNQNWADKHRNCFSHTQPVYWRMTLSVKIRSLLCGSRQGKRKQPSGTCLVAPERPETEVVLNAFLVRSPGWSQTQLDCQSSQWRKSAGARWLVTYAKTKERL